MFQGIRRSRFGVAILAVLTCGEATQADLTAQVAGISD